MTDSSQPRRTLVLLRHAKSAWPDVTDHERPLAPRGEKDAPEVGRWLAAAGHVPDQVLCSDARRTRETWQLVREQLEVDPPIAVDEQVYQATTGSLLNQIRRTEPSRRTLLVVGHAPAVPELALLLSGAEPGDAEATARIREKYPTAAVAVLEFTGDWAGLEPGAASLVAFVTPRELRPEPAADDAES